MYQLASVTCQTVAKWNGRVCEWGAQVNDEWRVRVWRLKAERFRGDSGDSRSLLRVTVTAVTGGTSPCVFAPKIFAKNRVGAQTLH